MQTKFPFHVLLLLLLAHFVRPLTTLAQGTAFTYQGRLTAGTNVANGTYHLRFRLFNDPNAGAQIGPSLTNAGVIVSNGYFAATLDFTNGAFPGADRWLEISVRTNTVPTFSVLTPRQRITPTPYAITASNISGTVSASGLAGSYSSPVAFNNPGNSFAGNGAGLTSLNASNLTTGAVPAAALINAWKTTGNAGTTAGTQFIGTSDNQPLELKVNGSRAFRIQKAGDSPNLTGGSSANFISTNVEGSFIGGGGSASAFFAFSNRIASSFAVIGGGNENVIETNSIHAAIGSGLQNRIQVGASSVIAGGRQNLITNAGVVFIGGGLENGIWDASSSTIAGGIRNTITNADRAFIGGGEENAINDSTWSAIAGGWRHTITSANESIIGAGSQNMISDSSKSLVGGGAANRILSQDYGFVGGGFRNQLGDTAVNGSTTILTNAHNAIVGGALNLITPGAYAGFIGGGRNNSITNGVSFAAIPGGRENVVGGDYAFAAGRKAKARHDGAFVWADSTDSDFSSSNTNQFLVRASGGVGINVTNPVDALHVQSDSGVRTRTTTTGTGFAGFVSENLLGEWFAGVASGTNHWYLFENAPASGARIVVKSGGNVGIGTLAPTNRLHVAGGVSATAFVNTSDRSAKENFAPISPKEILNKVARLPISTWNFKTMNDGRHMGPMAQDFYAAFGLGGGDTTITSVDPDGVALAAIQGLNQKLEQKEIEIEELRSRLEKLESQIRSPERDPK